MILLQSLKIENFRGIREGEIAGLTEVNILIGRNNSGKTTLIEAMHKFCQPSSGSADILGRSASRYWELVRNDTGEQTLRYKNLPTKLVQASGEVLDAQLQYGCRRVRSLLDMSDKSISWIRGNPPEIADKVEEFRSKVTPYRSQDLLDQNVESRYWPELLATRKDKQLVRILNTAFALQAESIQLVPPNRMMLLFEDYGVPLRQLGDGAQSAIRTLIVLELMSNSLFLLEEPECHQHPGSLERFAAAVCRLAKEQQVQLVISTHSAECVRAFMKGAAGAKSDAAVFHLSLTDGKQESRRLDPETVETLQETGVDVRFLDLYG